jgi:hypothetical protein
MARNLETVGDIEKLREMLIEWLEIEYHLKELQRSIKLCGPHAEAFIETEKLILYILYLEQRVGLKMLTLTCGEGLHHFRSRT